MSKLLFAKVSISLSLFATLLTPQKAISDDAETLTIIRAGYAHTITSIRNVKCEYSIRTESSRDNDNFNYGGEFPFVLAVEGNKHHKSSVEGSVGPGSHSGPRWFSGDGEFLYKIDHKLREVRKYSQIDGTHGLNHHLTPLSCLGVYFNSGDLQKRFLSLNDLLRSQPLKLAGKTKIEGDTCWEVHLNYPGVKEADDVPLKIWFNPKHGYLPQQIDYGGDGNMVYIIEEFIRVPVGSLQISFPGLAKLEAHSHELVQTIQTQSVEINTSLSQSLFRPKIPSGYRTISMDNIEEVIASGERNKPQPDGKSSERREAALEAQRQKNKIAKSSQSTFDATPKKKNMMLIVLMTGGFIMLVVASLMSLKRG
ncbi:hypothetical protein [Thalassoglobus polymorphus]|uniref:DUF3108 domain-containing protein n=1 Tax=Thalassoglobus polymorphus TaxID=2527994 RepID=A0A517QI85_9PLAN|nr:hypothetical protein [Thalassoglobus polymorphus]QDT31349.1 hypothetical protein Mal48_05820 [Thalassoglobus polymorphus]